MEKTAKKETLLKNLEKCLGVVSETCKKTKVARRTFYKWKDEDDDFRERANEIIENQKDFVESKLIERIAGGDTTAIIFYLKTKCKDRGYGDKTEIAMTIEQPLFSDDLLNK